MTIAAAYAALATVLTENAELQAWAAVIDGPLKVLKGNREVLRIDPGELPALVQEIGPLPLEPVVAGFESQGIHEMYVSFVWEEHDEQAAFDRKLALVDLVPRVLLANARLQDQVGGAWVSAIDPDLGFNHPRHSVRFTVSADVALTR